MTGKTLSHYRIGSFVGRGAMGEVYEAEDVNLGRRVAVKLLPAELCCDPAATERFTREAKIVSWLNHPNICTLYDFGEVEGRHFMVMELLTGQPLSARLARGPLTVDEVLVFGADVAGALATAHRQGVVHRDIKPANLFVTTGHGIKVLDFGVAELAESASALATTLGTSQPTSPGTAVGTLAYMSPEQARGQLVDARSDLFSLGVVLYEMAVGRSPFGGTTPAAIFESILGKAPPPPSLLRADLPAELDRVIARALEKDPGLRYQTAADLQAELKRMRRETDRTVIAAATGGAPQATRARRPRAWWLAAPALTAALVVGALSWQTTRTPALEPRDPVVLAAFINRTGDAAFDDTLGEALAVQLRQSPFLDVVSEQRVQATLRLMRREPDTLLTEEVGREVCQRVGARAVLMGTIASLGSSYVLTLRALHCVTGDTLAEGQTEAARKEDVLKRLGDASTSFRRRLGESLASVARYDAGVEQATTASLDALRAYSQALTVRRTRGERAALPLFQRAVALDPAFALAHARLGTAYANLDDTEASTRHTARAFELRDKVSDRERLYIEARYFSEVVLTPTKAIEAYRVAIATFPGDYVSRVNLAVLLTKRGELDEPITLLQEAATLAPEDATPKLNLAEVLSAAGRFAEARREAEQAAALRDDGMAREVLLTVAVLSGDAALEAAQLAWVATAPDAQGALPMLWRVATYRGQMREAERLLGEMERVSGTEGRSAAIARCRAETAVALAATHLGDRARRLLSRLPDVSSADQGADQRVIAAALLRDAPAARRALPIALHSLPQGVDGHTPASTLNALAQAASDDLTGALRLLGRVQYHPRDSERVLVHGLLSHDAGRWDEAIRDFEWLRDHGRKELSVSAGLIRFTLAAVYDAAGRAEDARKAYGDFLAFWHAADETLPLVLRAKEGLVRLGS